MENVVAQRVAVRCIVWLDGGRGFTIRVELKGSGERWAFAAWETMNQAPIKGENKLNAMDRIALIDSATPMQSVRRASLR